MNNKKDLISGIIFGIYFAMMLLFVPMVFFCGQVIGGGVYFVCFAITVAYFILDLKFEFSFKSFYRFFVYINDAINILAVAFFIYYGVHSWLTISTVSVLGLSLVADMICRDRNGNKTKLSLIANISDLIVMCSIFPYFYFEDINFAWLLIGLIFAVVMFACKVWLTVRSYKLGLTAENKEKKSELEKVIEDSVQDNVIE